jgi:hypothetical protein
MNTDNESPMGGLAMQAGGVPTFMKLIKKLTTDIKKAERAGDLATSLEKRKELNNAIQFGVNDPLMPRAQPLTQAEIRMYAERMAPQVAGDLTRGAGAKTIAGKSQKQFKREQTLPVDRTVLPGAVDPSAPLPFMTLEDQKGSVLLGLPGDPTLARVSLAGIDDVPFEQAVTQHGGPRYGDENKLWASNLSAATGLLNAADRASKQFGDAPVIASYMKMPSGFGFAQHYLESLLQYQRPDLLSKAAREALEKDIKDGFVKQGKRVAFPDFPGFDDLGAVAQAAEADSNLRKHIAAKLGTSEKYGLRSAADVQFAISHPELTNLETGASGFTLGELTPGLLTESAHPTYSHDIPGKVLGQMQYSTPYDLLYRDQLDLIRKNPEAPEFNTLKLLGARQQIDEQLVNEINEYQERMRQLLGRKKGGAVKKAEGGAASLTDLPDEVTPANWREHLQNNVLADARALLGVKDGGVINLDELIEKSLKKKDGGVINLDELIAWTMAKDEHRKMKEGGGVKMADGGQTFPLQRPEEVTDLKPRPRTKRDELLEMLSKGVGSVHEFMAKPFGYENPPGEMVSSLIGLPGAAKTLERMAYGDPLTSGAGMTTNLLPETTEAAFLGLGAAPTALKATKAAGKALAPTAKEMMDVQLQRMMSPYQMNVIKPEGGNWIKGAAQKYVNPLRARMYDSNEAADPAMRLQSLYEKYGPEGAEEVLASGMFPHIQEKAALNRFVDKKLTRYIQNELGTPSDSLRLQADAWADTQQKLMADKQKQIDKVRADIEKARQERNVNPEVLTRSQARLRELQKEQDLIKNRKGIHSVPRAWGDIDAEVAQEARKAAGMPVENMGVSPVGKSWENTSDRAIKQAPYADQMGLSDNRVLADRTVNSPESYMAALEQFNRESLERLGGQYAVDNPQALAYTMSYMPPRDLGFDHLMDELHNALLNEGLPEYLQLTPKTLDKMSVAQAAEHVDKINAWRASQKAEVDKARAANAATVVHKEYPEQGLQWVELKMPDVGDVVPEGWSAPVAKGNALQTKSINGDVVLGDSLPELIKNIYKRHPNTPGNPRSALEDALKYEGEILQHCVGGYCPDVVEGKSRIFSLRDADGRPHATIEVQPSDDYDLQKAIDWKTYLELQEKDPDAAVKYAAEIKANLPSKIKQIKGAQNRKPEDKFIPYIQDFVKSDDWHSVGDLGHTDLIDLQRDPVMLDMYLRDILPYHLGFQRKELLNAAINANPNAPRFMTPEQLRDLIGPVEPPAYAKGGRITKSDLEREYRMAFGGGVFNTDPDITDSGRIIPHNI